MSKIKPFIFLVILMLAQVQYVSATQIDSLKSILQLSNNDSIKCIIYTKLFSHYIQFNPDSAQYFAQTGLTKSTKIKYPKGIADLTLFDAFVDYNNGDFLLARTKMQKGLTLLESKYNYHSGENNLRLWIANTYREENKFDSSKIFLDNIIHSKNTTNPLEIASTYQSLANIYQIEEDFEQALFYYFKSDSICNAHRSNDNHCITTIANIGTLFKKLGNFEKASYYFNLATEKYIEIGSKYQEAEMQFHSAQVDIKLMQYRDAEVKLVNALQYFTDMKNPKIRQNILGTIADLYTKTNRLSKAIEALEIRKDINAELKDSLSYAESIIQLGEVQGQLFLYSKGISNIQAGLTIAKKLDYYTGISRGYAALGDIYFISNDFKNAAIANKELVKVNEAYTENTNREKLEELETRYETHKRLVEIEKLTLQNQLSTSELERKKAVQSRLIILILLLALGLSFLWYWMFTQKRVRELKHQESIRRKNELIDGLQSKLTEILSSQKQQVENGKFISMQELNQLIQFPLTDREYDVLVAIADGKTNIEASKTLFVSENTVKFHLKNIYNKLDVSNRIQALDMVKN